MQRHLKTTVSYLRKVVALLIGIPLLIIGLILIPLPGPGLLVCFVGLLVLSLEFEWAHAHKERVKTSIKKTVDKRRGRIEKE